MNIKNSILLLDPKFDPETAPNCNLLIKITNDSFSYAIINEESKRLKAIFDEQECRNISQTLTSSFKNDPYLKYPFKQVKISVTTNNSIAVPNEFYQVEDIPKYTNFFSTAQQKNVYVHKNERFNFTSVFNLQPVIEEHLDTNFKSSQKYEQTAPVLVLAQKGQNALILDFTALSFTAVYIQNEQLIFQNSYEIENAEEFNYYLLLMLKKLEIDPNHTQVNISGIINENDGNHQIIQKYFKAIQFNLPGNEQIDCAILDDMPAYYYSSLLAIDLCG